MMNRFLLEAYDFWESQPGEDLHVEDFLDRSLEFEEGNVVAAAKVDHGDTALKLPAALGERHAVHRGRSANLRQADERVMAGDGQATCEAGECRNRFTTSRDMIDKHDSACS